MEAFCDDARQTIKDCRERLDKLSYDYQTTQALFHEKYQVLLLTYSKYREEQKIGEIFQSLQDVKNLSKQVDEHMRQRDFRGAVEFLKCLDTMIYKPPLSELKALDDMREDTIKRLEKCHRKLFIELERES